MLPLRERNKQKTRERILRAAIALFQRGGYTQTTMDAIAEKAEVSRATLFNYFATKDTLLVPFARQIFETQSLPSVRDHLKTNPTTLDALRFLFMSIYEHGLSVPNIDPALKHQILFHVTKAGESGQMENDSGYLDILCQILHQGQQRGEIGAAITVESQARYIGTLYLAIFYSPVSSISDVDYPAELESLLLFISQGLKLNISQ